MSFFTRGGVFAGRNNAFSGKGGLRLGLNSPRLAGGGAVVPPAGYVFLVGKAADASAFTLRGKAADGSYSTLLGKVA